MNVNSDPMMALIFAAHARSQIALEDLSGLANDQKASNDMLKALRGLENQLRKFRDDGKITRTEIDALAKEVAGLAAQGVNVDVAQFLDTLTKELNIATGGGERGILVRDAGDYDVNGEDYLWANDASPHENHKANDKSLDNIKDAIADAKENVKAEVSNRELDMQRVTQEVSSAMQLQSNLSKRWSDVGNAIIGNLRA